MIPFFSYIIENLINSEIKCKETLTESFNSSANLRYSSASSLQSEQTVLFYVNSYPHLLLHTLLTKCCNYIKSNTLLLLRPFFSLMSKEDETYITSENKPVGGMSVQTRFSSTSPLSQFFSVFYNNLNLILFFECVRVSSEFGFYFFNAFIILRIFFLIFFYRN
jgi:hypothetical protein